MRIAHFEIYTKNNFITFFEKQHMTIRKKIIDQSVVISTFYAIEPWLLFWLLVVFHMEKELFVESLPG